MPKDMAARRTLWAMLAACAGVVSLYVAVFVIWLEPLIRTHVDGDDLRNWIIVAAVSPVWLVTYFARTCMGLFIKQKEIPTGEEAVD